MLLVKLIQEMFMSNSFTGINYSDVDQILEKYHYEKSCLIAILQEIQAIYSYLPQEVMTYVGEKIDELSPSTVYGVATFYAQFSLEPKGKYEIKICDGTACHVRGSSPVLEAVKKKLKLEKGKYTTADGLFSLEVVSCLGACGLAPAIVINNKVHPQMTADAVTAIIDTLVKEERGE